MHCNGLVLLHYLTMSLITSSYIYQLADHFITWSNEPFVYHLEHWELTQETESNVSGHLLFRGGDWKIFPSPSECYAHLTDNDDDDDDGGILFRLLLLLSYHMQYNDNKITTSQISSGPFSYSNCTLRVFLVGQVCQSLFGLFLWWIF